MFKTTYSRRYREFLTALRQARTEQSVTQAQLAKRLRVTQSWVSKIERGARRMDVVELELWCKALGLSLGEFLERL
jgi:transcriptional regulator with XRE-family HTH domain